jgi:lipoprotein-anchoring transpeptidase ErfK/SrfK
VSGLGAVILLVTGCSSGTHSSATGSGATTAESSSPTPTVKTPAVTVDGSPGGNAATVSYQTPVKLLVADGSFSSVQVSSTDGGVELDGTLSGDGASWVSQEPPRPASAYKVSATVKDSGGQESTQTVSFSVASVPANQKVGFTVTPSDGATVGIGQPIDVRFLVPIKERAAFEKVMTITATGAGGQKVVGSWHWLSSQEVHWRPKDFWTPGTKVTLDMKIAGVKAGPDRYGRQDFSETFTIGSSHVTKVDGVTHRVQVFRDGKLVATWPGGTGRPGLETYSGTYVVLGKASQIVMDSCSARITCDKKNPDYYSEKEYWATRVTASGTFLHAASWDGMLGKANVSHGCVHLSDADAQEFYNHAVVGDVVIVSRTGRGPQERIATQDPGLYDWNLTWAQWIAGSALK